jgi:dTDP-glucose 4,6-dehydratase/UDP-glucose 4-epimerase
MKIGVIGYKGFIGSSFVNHNEEGIEIVGVDLPRDWWVDSNSAIDLIEFDFLINAAGSADVSNSFTNPKIDFESNVLLPKHLLESIRISGKKIHFINFSSAAVYGNPKLLPIEANHILEPLSPYGLHKVLSEQILNQYFHFWQIPTISLRVFSCYGNGNRKQALWELCNQAISKRGKELLVAGNKTDSRDFIHIADLVRQIMMLIKSPELFRGNAINIANGVQISIYKVAEIIASYFGCDSIKFSEQSIKGYPANWQADISDLIEIGYWQTKDIKQGIFEYCAWFESVYGR